MKNPRPSSRTANRLPSPAPASASDEVEYRAPKSRGHEKVPPQWAWHHRALLHLRNRIQRAHAEHASEANLPPNNDSNDPADSAQDQTDRDLLWAELGAENDKLFEIDCALQRIRDGVYGLCEVTGRTISPERLRAVPWTRYCRDAAAAREARPQRAV